MGNYLKPGTSFVAFLFLCSATFSQSPLFITGNVHNAVSKEKVPAVSVTIKGSTTGTFTDDRGNFRLATTHQPPIVLVFSSVGFETQEVTVDNASTPVGVAFRSSSSLGTEVVVSASRVAERILESPVSVERVGTAAIRNSPATDYYNVIRTLKGVDVTSSSLTFNSVTTRGFNGSGNPRFNQFVDGMDNQAPGLNFSVGSVIGLTQLDVDNMELLQGASSALYGSGGMTGTLLINSKDPFKYQGVSAEVKEGVMHVGKSDPFGASPYHDISFRWGVKVSDKFAFKIGGEYIQAKDWAATNESDYFGAGAGLGIGPIAGTRASDPNYNGVNIYGDETSANMLAVTNTVLATATAQYTAQYESLSGGIPPSQVQINTFLASNPQTAPFYQGKQAGIIPNQNVSRTGYKETDVIDHDTKVLRVSGGFYYKFTPHVMLSLTGNYGTGNTVYTGSDRYSLKGLKMGQYKLELKADRWFLRAYTTQENSGQAYNATVTTQLVNEAWGGGSTVWFPTFIGNYVGAYSQAVGMGASPAAAQASAFAFARQQADAGRPVPGSAQFKQILDSVRSKPIPQGGLFLDRTNLYQTEGQYNLTDYVKFAEVIVGASWRQYVLNSQGTLFADSAGHIHTNEFGAYLQIAKKFFDDKLKLTASGRYDKNTNFQGKFTPRFSAVFEPAKDNYIRASFQNAYRFPSNQNQWINLNTGEGILIGGLPSLRSFYHFDSNPVYSAASFAAFAAAAQAGTVNPGLLQQQTFGTFKPETVNSYELGYKSLINKTFLVDVYGYYSEYQNLIGRVSVVQFGPGGALGALTTGAYQGYSVSTNSATNIYTHGFGLSLDYLLPGNYTISGNVSTDRIHNPDSTFTTYFNTPKYRFNIGLSNSGFGHGRKFGFNVQYRWQDAYFTESDFRQGDVSAFGTIDAQISYKLPATHSMIKLGATNLLDHYYVSQYGNPAIGGLYYVSFAYNVF
jgi:outer membrane receptor for ferrienterochelin and colicin